MGSVVKVVKLQKAVPHVGLFAEELGMVTLHPVEDKLHRDC